MKASTAAVMLAGTPWRSKAARAAAKQSRLARLVAGSAGPSRAARSHGNALPAKPVLPANSVLPPLTPCGRAVGRPTVA